MVKHNVIFNGSALWICSAKNSIIDLIREGIASAMYLFTQWYTVKIYFIFSCFIDTFANLRTFCEIHREISVMTDDDESHNFPQQFILSSSCIFFIVFRNSTIFDKTLVEFNVFRLFLPVNLLVRLLYF